MVRLLLLALDLKPEEDEAECIHVKELAYNLGKMDHEVLLVISRSSIWSAEPPQPHLTIEALGGGFTGLEILRVLRRAKAFRPDVIYERRFLPKVSGALSSILGIPALVEINGLVDDELRMQGKASISVLPPALRTHLHRMVYRRLWGIVTVTSGLASEMSRLYGIPPERITVIENAANTKLFRPLDKAECRRELGLLMNDPWICFEGGLYPWHGIDTLLRAIKLTEDTKPTLHLLIVGDGPCRDELESLSKKLGVASRVHFTGRVPYESVPLHIGACDVGVGPFTRERNERIGISPIKVYEYVACGRPVVVSRLPGLSEWVEREQLGFLTEPGNPSDLALKIKEALQNETLLAAMVLRGPAAVEKAHSWESVTRRVAMLCSEAAHGG